MSLLEMLLGIIRLRKASKIFLIGSKRVLPGKAMMIRKFWNVMGKSPTGFLPRIMNRQPVMPSGASPRQIGRSLVSY